MIASSIIGHRGAADLAPENTLAGIRKAAECGIRWVELDVTLLGDGTPVLCHDDRLDRCTNATGPLTNFTASDLPLLDAGSWFNPDWIDEPMPHLSDALLLCQQLGLGLNLELKPYALPGDLVARKVFEEISVYWQSPEKLIISSFDHELLGFYRYYDLFAQIGLLFEHLPEFWQLKAEALQAISIHCDWRLINAAEIALIKAAGYDLYCYTCNEPEEAARLFKLGVDALFTDNPLLISSSVETDKHAIVLDEL